MQVMKSSPKLLLPGLVFTAALVVRMAVVAFWNFDGLYGQDAFAYYEQATAIADRLVNGWSALPAFFWPHGYPFLSALTMVVFGEGTLGPQMLNVLFGSLLAVVVFLLARDMCRSLTDEDGAASSNQTCDWCGFIAGICNVWWLNRFMDRAAEVRAVADEVATHLPDGGRVIAFGITGAIGHYTNAEVFELFNLSEQDLGRLCDGSIPTLLVVDRDQITGRWKELSPDANIEWLTRERSVRVVREIGPWSISRIGPGTADRGGAG